MIRRVFLCRKEMKISSALASAMSKDFSVQIVLLNDKHFGFPAAGRKGNGQIWFYDVLNRC